jgi:hypothetical protein
MLPPTRFRLRVTAILLITAGYGWAGGHFIPPDAPFLAYVFQLTILLLLLICAMGFFSISGLPEAARPKRGWAVVCLTVFAALSLLINIANIIRGAMLSPGQAYGSHNSMPDLVPITLLIVGDLLWLLSLELSRQTGIKKE